MLSKDLLNNCSGKSVIRELYAYGQQQAKLLGAQNVFDYSLGNPNVPVPREVNNSIMAVLQNEDAVSIFGYGPANGYEAARDAVAKDLNERFGIGYSADNIFLALSAAGALQHALRVVTDYGAGDEIITFAPYFPEYSMYVKGAGANLQICKADVKSFQINFDELELLLNEKTKAVLINSPNNPTGIIYSEDTIKKLAALLEEKSKQYGHTIYLISDEPYREIVFDEVESPYIGNYYKHTLVCYSYSKSLSIPGSRLGYVAFANECDGAEHMMDCLMTISRMIGFNGPNTLMQKALTSIAGMTADLKIYGRNKKMLYTELTKMGYECVEPMGTFYMFPRSLEPDANQFCERAKEFNLILVPGDSFGCPSHFRIAYCIATEKVERSLEAFQKLKDVYSN